MIIIISGDVKGCQRQPLTSPNTHEKSALSWQLSDHTKITFTGEYQVRSKKFGQQGIPAQGSVLPNPNGKIGRDRNTSEPDATIDTSSLRVG